MLEEIEAEDYQSLESVRLPLGRFTVIVGPSGHGKSAMIRALKALCFNQVGHRFIRHHRPAARVKLTFDGGKTVEWAKPRDKSATYTFNGVEYTRTGRKVPEEIENALSIRRVDVDKGISFTPQFHSQSDLPLLLTESSTMAARALAKFTKLSVLVEAQMDCRRDFRREQRDHEAAEQEAKRLKEKMDELPRVRRGRNVLERATKVMRAADEQLGIVKQADDIAQDITGSLLIADIILPRMVEIEALSERVAELEDMVSVVQEAKNSHAAVETASQTAKKLETALTDVQDQYAVLVEELGACPLCGSTETWGDHEHAAED